MTPLPKKKHAKARTRTRKAVISLTLPKLTKCPNCKELKIPHRVCPSCGFYKSQREPESIEVPEKLAEEKETIHKTT